MGSFVAPMVSFGGVNMAQVIHNGRAGGRFGRLLHREQFMLHGRKFEEDSRLHKESAVGRSREKDAGVFQGL